LTSLTATEVLHWNDTNTAQWRKLFERHPEALALPCDIRGSSTVADLLQHIVAVELRYAERLGKEAVTEYAEVSKESIIKIFAVHDRAIAKINILLADATYDWELEIDMETRQGRLIASRKAVLFHALLHSMRHYAQLATLLRHGGITATWPMDYLMVTARRA
jgi:uncharacterized damage-inducible protein DinB